MLFLPTDFDPPAKHIDDISMRCAVRVMPIAPFLWGIDTIKKGSERFMVY